MAASATVGGIKVKIGSDISGFETGLQKTRKGLNSVGKWGAAAAAAVAVGAAAIVKSQLAVLDSLAKTSDALGIQQEKLQALQHIGELTGTSNEMVNKSLERMQRNLGAAARLGGASADALEDLGVNLKDIVSLKPEEQMEVLANALSGVESQVVKASIANDVFGRNGTRMLKMLEQLKSEGLDPTVKALDSIGVSLTRIETSKVEQANDALFKASEVTTGLANKLTVKLSPVLEAIANQFIDAATESKGFSSTMDAAFNNSISVIGVFADGLHGVQAAILGIANVVNFMAVEVGKAFTKNAQMMDGFANSVGSAANDAQNMLKKVFGQDNFTEFVPTESTVAKYFQDELLIAENAFNVTSEKFQEILNKPLPSESLKQWVAEVTEVSNAVAEKLTNAIVPVGDGGESSTPVNAKAAEAAQKELENLLTLNETKLETINTFEQSKLDLIKGYRDEELISDAEHEAAKVEIEENAANARLAIAKAEAAAKKAATSMMFNDLASLMNSGSKKAFKIGKAAAIANASIKGVGAAVSAWDAGMSTGGPWAPVVAAAYAGASLLKTGTMINQIKSQQFGGASSPTSSFSGGLPTVNTGGGQSQQSQTNVSIDIVGSENSTFSRGQIESLIGGINDATGDGVVLNTGG